MKITSELLKKHSACADGAAWVYDKFGDNGGYQDVLNALADAERDDWASWLLNKLGTTGAVLEIDGDLITEKSVFFAGAIKATGSIKAVSIKADYIEARSIKAGYIEARSIKAVSIKADDIEARSIVSPTKPANIVYGKWRDKL